MAEEKSNRDRIADIKARMNHKPSKSSGEPLTKWQRIKQNINDHIKEYATAAIITAGIVGGYFTLDYLVKRQDYPIRNTVLNTKYMVEVAGNKEKRAAEKADRATIIKYYGGGSEESKINAQIAETRRDKRGNLETYTMYDEKNERVIRSALKNERFQIGLRINGATTYKEESSEILVPLEKRMPKRYMVYKVDPERGWKQNDIDVVEFPFERGLKENEPGIIGEILQEDGTSKKGIKIMINRLVESRNALGWFRGSHYRDGTLLQDFLNAPTNKELAKNFLQGTGLLDSDLSTPENAKLAKEFLGLPEKADTPTREDLVSKILKIEKKMDRKTIYSSREDGFFKWLPQDSTIYLGEDPGFWKKTKHHLFGWTRNESDILRVDNNWNFFPWGLSSGNYPLLDEIPIGKGRDRFYPFDKYNNGGYTIKDKFGKIAKIEIKDFWFKYGQDVIYNYYFDLNGDGKINKKTELIGSVLCTPTHDEKAEIEKLAAGIIPENDLTVTTLFSFMAPPNVSKEKGWDYFKMCAYVETIVADAVRRGDGQHSLLRILNDQRSDEILRREPSVENVSRALTAESILAAKYDIVRVLIESKRPYAEKIARDYGIYDEFKGQFQPSNLLEEKIELGPLPEIGLALAAGVGGLYYLKRRHRTKTEMNIANRLDKLKTK
ncbi:MAG: hypothetical protein PHH54_01610 [Candidatus Nanoarchaeia archaeon]|nr:hypothetical protein [Candidatus Nanoarchaeia archaeon]MDD5740659.1 hypothetical protein [Candidatus Nanoarchaeia archaeon]